MKMNTKNVFPALIFVLLLASGSAVAQTGIGLRAGVSTDPAQFDIGAHYVSDSLVERLTFRPNLEVGVGNDVTTVTANFEFVYSIKVPKRDFSVYFGAGPGLVVRKLSNDRGTDTGGGFNMLIGVEHENGLFGELKVGALDSPDIKFTIGYTFR